VDVDGRRHAGLLVAHWLDVRGLRGLNPMLGTWRVLAIASETIPHIFMAEVVESE
jgi:hypothetical protein